METIVKNVFLVGPQVSGPSFIGRTDWVKKLSEDLFDDYGCISLVGPTRIGKSSLVNRVLELNGDREGFLIVRLCMGEYTNAFAFWMDFMDQLRDAIEDADLLGDVLDALYEGIGEINPSDSMWNIDFKKILRRVMKQLRKINCRVILVIDEFDGIVKVFGSGETSIPDYMLLRSVFSETHKYNINGIVISRRTLKFMEQKVPSLSTFHGVFERETLSAFNELDMASYYQTLADCGVTLTGDGREQLEHYTGGIPYLCSIFGKRMVEKLPVTRCCDSECICEIYRERKATILEYYGDLVDRLEDDRHLEPLLYLSLGSTRPLVDGTDLEVMESLGVLRYDDCFGYYAYSADFMKYLRTQPLKVPYWELLISVESCLKKLLAKTFPQLEQTGYKDLKGADSLMIRSQLEQRFPILAGRWAALEQTCASLAVHKDVPSLLDSLTLGDVIDLILANWEQGCCLRFGSGDWAEKLRLIRRLYNPLANANSQYVTRQDVAVCSRYCQELLRIEF